MFYTAGGKRHFRTGGSKKREHTKYKIPKNRKEQNLFKEFAFYIQGEEITQQSILYNQIYPNDQEIAFT